MTDDAVLDFQTEGTADRIAARQAIPVLPPKDMRVVRQGSMLLLIVRDRGRVISKTGVSAASHYAIYWAEQVDETTKAGIDAGATRATKIDDLQRAFIEDKELTCEISNGKYQNGYLYVFGANALGDRSVGYLFSGKQTADIVDDTIPSNVENLAASESGEQHNGTVLSAVAFSYFAPPESSFAGVLWAAEHYPNPGEVTFLSPDVYIGPPHGRSTGKLLMVPARRVGIGTVTLSLGSATVNGVSSKFLKQARAGDLVEALGVQGTIQSVNSDTGITLTATWTGKSTGAGFADFYFIGRINLYAVPLSKAGTHLEYTKASHVDDILLDAELSAPNAPSLSGESLGNVNRLIATAAAGTSIDFVTLYRGKGVGLSSTDALVKPIFVWRKETHSLDGVLQFDDQDFTIYDREQGQIYSYFAAATNARGKQGTFSSRVEVTCRLDSPADGGGTNPARFVAKNLMWNAMLSGDAGAVNAASNASVDANMGVALPGGFYRPFGAISGVGSQPSYQNGREVLLAMTAAAAAGVSLVQWQIDASDNATAANRRVPKGKMVSIQWQARHSPGSINGLLVADIVQVSGLTVTAATNATPIVITTSANHGLATGQTRVFISGVTGNTAANGVWTITVTGATTFSLDGSVGNGAYVAGGTADGLAGFKRRSSSDVVDYDTTKIIVAGSDLTDVHSLYWGAFYLDPAFITTHVLARIYYDTTNWSGVNIVIIEPMLALGDGIPYWSAEIDPNTTYPPVGGGVAPPRGRFTDRDGYRREFIRLP